jgi:methyl-accepting chemotaxis protein
MRPHASQHLTKRRILFVKPRLQGTVALCFAAVVFAGAALFSWFFCQYARTALRIASLQGHYDFLSPQEIIGGELARYVLALSAGVLAGSFLVLLLILRRIRGGLKRIQETFRSSMDGDLSSPTNATGLSDVAELGRGVDASRSRTLSRIRKIRADAEFLRSEPLPDEEFAKRWDALKSAIRQVVP